MAPDLSTLRRVSRENLSRALRVVRGKKILVIESKLTATLDLIANYQFLKDHGVVKVHHLENSGPPQPLPTESCSQVLYLISSDLISAKLVCDQINSNVGSGIEMGRYGVVVVPRRLHVITSLFESEGVYGHVEFGQYAYEMIQLDEHILSLQFEDLVPNLWLHQDTSYLPPVAKALFNLRGIYGDFHHLIAIGPYSRTLVNQMGEYEFIYQNNLQAHNRRESDIPTVIIMDRALDFLSPLLTPLTYEGMLDEIFGIKGRTITFGPEVTGKEVTKQILNSSDPIFERVRNLHFSHVVSQLVSQAKDLKRQKEGSAGLNVHAMKSFVANDLKKIQVLQKTLSLHLGALDLIIKEKANDLKKLMDLESNILLGISHRETQSFLEDSMAKGLDPVAVLRLFCLCTLSQDGLRDFKSLKTQFVQSYGFKYLVSLHNLEKMGVLYPFRGIEVNAKGVAQVLTRVANSASLSSSSPSSSGSPSVGGSRPKKSTTDVPFQTILKKLIPPANVEVKLDVPKHPSYVFNGNYTPFIAKLVDEILSTLVMPKTNSALIEKKLEDLMKFYLIGEYMIKCKSGMEAYGRGRNALVFVLGGITRSEIAALQLIGRSLDFNIICGGTDITNGKKIISSAVAS